MCKAVEEVLKEGTNAPVECEITMDGEVITSDDFVCVIAKPNGDTAIYYNTDAITLGMAMKLIAKSFVDSMAQLSEEEREMVSSVLGGDFSTEEDAN